jgi:hypothetical protein
VACRFSRTRGLVEGKDMLPVLLHVDHRSTCSPLPRLAPIELAEMRMAVVGIFALRIGVVDDQAKARAACAERRPLQHFEIAVGLPKAAMGRRPICSLMPIGFPVLSSMKLTSDSRKSVAHRPSTQTGS